MKNKYFILVITFLCLLAGQSTYSQDWQDMGFDDATNALIQDFEDQGGTVDVYDNAQDYADAVNNDDDPNNDYDYGDDNNDSNNNSNDNDNTGVAYWTDSSGINMYSDGEGRTYADMNNDGIFQPTEVVDDSLNSGSSNNSGNDDDSTDIYDGLLDTHNYDNNTGTTDDDQYPPDDTPTNNDNTTPEEPVTKKYWYLDNDGDGYYISYLYALGKPSGNYKDLVIGFDCDDTDATKNEGSDCGYRKWYLDADGDGYHSDETESVDSPGLGEGWVLYTRGVDCEESDPTITTQCWPLTPSTCKGCLEEALDDINNVYFDSTTDVIPYNFEAGKNNIFDANGRPLRSGASGNLLQIEIDGVLKSPSQLLRTEGTLKALNKIATFYAQSKGYVGLVKIVNTVGKKQGNDVAFYGNGVLTVRAIAFSEGKFNNVHDFISTINHEIFHWKDPKTGTKDYQFKDHANIYLLQASDPDFKNSSDWNKINTANQYMVRIFNSSRAHEVGMNNDGIIAAMQKYNNENTGGVKMYDMLFSSAGVAGLRFSTSINGQIKDNQYKYEELENTAD